MNDSTYNKNVNDSTIDIVEIVTKIWSDRKKILKYCGIAAIIGIVIGFSIPKEYTTVVKLAPEISSSGKSMGNLSALAGIAGINMNATQGTDALSPELYPDIISSNKFTTSLFKIRINDITVYEYLSKYQKSPWWITLLKMPFYIISKITSNPEKEVNTNDTNLFHLTREEEKVSNALSRNIKISIDKSTSVISLSVTMQDPIISATLADSVLTRLKEYITEYRTNKARIDLDFTQKLYDESKAKYYKAQQEYANFFDSNLNIRLKSVEGKQERLQNEMNLAFNLYNQTAQQLQMAKAKVQENTPVFTVIQSASVPLKPSRPSKKMIVIGLVFLTFVFRSAWIILDIKHTKKTN